MLALEEARRVVGRKEGKAKGEGKLGLERNKGKLMGSLKMDGCG